MDTGKSPVTAVQESRRNHPIATGIGFIIFLSLLHSYLPMKAIT